MWPLKDRKEPEPSDVHGDRNRPEMRNRLKKILKKMYTLNDEELKELIARAKHLEVCREWHRRFLDREIGGGWG